MNIKNIISLVGIIGLTQFCVGQDIYKESGFFGICNSAEGGGEFPRYFPELHNAGVTVARAFPEWNSLQAKHGEWNFDYADKLIKTAKANDIEILATFGYLAQWASSNGDSRTFPIKDMQYWRDYVAGTVGRYHNYIKYWGVYNEFQGFSKNGKVEDYVKMLQDAYITAKKIDPTVKIGLATSSVDMSFLENVIKSGGADHFDWIDIHPYELQGAISGDREYLFLQIVPNLKKLLKKYNQRDDIEIIVGEVGLKTTDLAKQADMIVKTYVLCLAQGVEKVFWFEARGPYKMGLISFDSKWEKYPGYYALKNMTTILGLKPKNIGWLDLTGNSYSFVIEGVNRQPVMVAWAMTEKGDKIKFDTPVTVYNIMGNAQKIQRGQEIVLTKDPVYIVDISSTLVSKARANSKKEFPWIKDYANEKSVSCIMGAANTELGLMQNDRGDGETTLEIMDDGSYARRTNKAKRREYIYFYVDDSYASIGDSNIEITFTAKAFDINKNSAFNLTYESTNGYIETKDFFVMPKTPGWHTYTFKLDNANFGNTWGWNFRVRTSGWPGDVLIQKVEVRKVNMK